MLFNQHYGGCFDDSVSRVFGDELIAVSSSFAQPEEWESTINGENTMLRDFVFIILLLFKHGRRGRFQPSP